MNSCLPFSHTFNPCVTGVGRIVAVAPLGDEPYAVSAMGRADTASRNNDRLDGISRLFEVFAHEVGDVSLLGAVNIVTLTEESGRTVHISRTAGLYHREDSINVFSNDESGLYLPDDSKHFRPEVTVVCRSLPSPGCGEWLAGKASRKYVDAAAPFFKVGCLDVFIGNAIRVPILQDCSAEVVYFAMEEISPPHPCGGQFGRANAAEERCMCYGTCHSCWFLVFLGAKVRH